MKRHAQFIKLGLTTNPIIATQLLNNYASSHLPNSLSYAHKLFDEIPQRDTLLWTSLITLYANSTSPQMGLHIFSLFHRQSHPIHKPNHFTFAAAAKSIAGLGRNFMYSGQMIHAHLVKSGFFPGYIVVGTAFLDMYAKLGSVGCALKVFHEMPQRNLVTWNAMVSGCVRNGLDFDGLDLFYRMKCCESLMADGFSVASVLVACAKVRDLMLGMELHAYVIVSGLYLDCVNSLCNMYFQCGQVLYAEKVLCNIEGDLILQLIKIRGYVLNSLYANALKCFASECSVVDLLEVDHTAIVPVLTVSAKLSLLNVGRQVHGLFVTMEKFSKCCLSEEDDVIIGSALIDMYSKCNKVWQARKVFDNWYPFRHLSHWNSIINGFVLNSLVEEARALLEKMPEKSVVAFTSVVTGYVQSDMPKEALHLLGDMYDKGIEGNSYSFVVALEACSLLTDLGKGKQIHAKLVRTSINIDTDNVIVGTALVDLYLKAGNINYAQTVFDSMKKKNVTTWTSIITGYALHGMGNRALRLFNQMIDTGAEPNEVTFVSVLTACSHCGLVEEGLKYFKLMKDKYKLVPREDHYTCLIDMLGRVGRLEEAWKILQEIDTEEISSHAIWTAMLGACHLHGDVELGKRVATVMMKKKGQDTSTYITLSNVYAAAGLWKEAYETRERLEDLNGEPGLSKVCIGIDQGRT